MKEIIARAAWEKSRELCAANGVETLPWDEIEAKEHHLLVADAVLAAMREPTPEMIQSRIDRYPTELRIRDSDLETWRDMIDAARAPSS